MPSSKPIKKKTSKAGKTKKKGNVMDEFKFLFKTGGAVLVIILVLFLMPFGVVTVDPTEVAVKVEKLGHKVVQEPLGVGYHLVFRWTEELVKYKVSARAYPSDTKGNENGKEYTMDLKTNDGQNVQMDLTIIYALIANDVPQLHQYVGPNYEDQILLPQIRSEARLAIGKYSAEEIYQGKVRDEIQQSIKAKLAKAVEKYPAIQVQDALIRHFQFSKAFEDAIESKKLAAQQVEVNKNLALAQEEKSKQQEAAARGDKLQAIQKAEGEAAAVKINADAERYRLEQSAAGDLARFKAAAEGQRLAADALGGGANVVALEFAKNIPSKLQIYGFPVGQQSTSLMDVSGIFKSMLEKK